MIYLQNIYKSPGRKRRCRPIVSAFLLLAASVLTAQSTTQQSKLFPSFAFQQNNLNFGARLAISNEYIAASATGYDLGSNSDQGIVYVADAGSSSMVALLPGGLVSSSDNFGTAVALSGDHLLVGAPNHDYDASNGSLASNAGKVYVFEHTGSAWNGTNVQQIVASTRSAGARFGQSIATSGDYAIIGAYQDDGRNNNSEGAAYIFEKDASGTWTEAQKLVANDGIFLDRFGISVAIDGNYAVVGADQYSNTTTKSGKAYIFKKGSDGTWTQQVMLEDDMGVAKDRFGVKVAISGSEVLVGADQLGQSTATGKAYAYHNDDDSWSLSQTLVASDAASGDRFGLSLAIAANYAVVGALNHDGANSNEGQVYLYALENSTWNEVHTFQSGDVAAEDRFGQAVAILGDDVLVGAPGQDAATNGTTNLGSVYTFALDFSIYWTGAVSSDWSTAENWSGGQVPTSTDDVVIAAVSTAPVVDEDATVKNLTIDAGALLTISSGSSVTLQVDGDFTNNQAGGLVVESGSSFRLMRTRSGAGTETFKRSATGGAALQAIATPLSDATVADLGADHLYAFVAPTNSFTEPTGTLFQAQGYFAGFDSPDHVIEVTGEMNYGQVDIGLSDDGDRYNLVGNPYASPVLASDFFTTNSSVLDGSGTAWLWADGGGNGTTKRLGNYVTVNSAGAAGGPLSGSDSEGEGSPTKSTVYWDGSFNSFQGFFVKAAATGGTLTFTPSMQNIGTANGNNGDFSFFRATADMESKKLRLSLSGNDLSDNILVVLDDLATMDADYSLDGEKFSGNESIAFYTVQLASKYAITALPLHFEEQITLPLGIDLAQAGTYTFKVKAFEQFEWGQVALWDTYTGKRHLLNEASEVRFSISAPVSESDRFVLVFEAAEALNVASERIKLAVSGSREHLTVHGDYEGADLIALYDVSGRQLSVQEVVFQNGRATLDGFSLLDNQSYILSSASLGTLKFIFTE